MLNYHDTIGHFPAQAIYDKNGKPLLSWRVQILPYIEQQPLYNEFHLDEPWDSEHNKKLLGKMPKTYASSPAQSAEVAGLKNRVRRRTRASPARQAALRREKRLTLAQLTAADGTSNTIAGGGGDGESRCRWTKPDDIPVRHRASSCRRSAGCSPTPS